MRNDVVIVGAGPSGLSAALALGRARKRVLLCDSGPRRNAAAAQIHNFVTRDGTPPDEFRRIAREQLAIYATVEIEDSRVHAIAGERGAFRIELGSRTVEARRVILATGMVDEMVAIDGFAEHWGHSVVQCPYCHGWEERDRRWGYLILPASAGHFMMFAPQLRGWTSDVTVFTNGAFEVGEPERAQLQAAGIRLETSAIARLEGQGKLERVVLASGASVPCDLLFAHPAQRQVPLVRELGVALDDDGYVKVDPMKRETSRAGVYASGDLTTRMQGAIIAAASGTQVASMVNVDVTVEQVLAGTL